MTKKIICYVITAIWIVLLSGCNTPPDRKYYRDGKQYGQVNGLFRQRWWNFYERGNSFSDGGFWEEAASDYRQALEQRDRDQRSARTYGMHFTDYFPHRDLGVAYYYLGKYEEAETELERSLSESDSGKTKFYLNKVRGALLKASNRDTSAPEINVFSVAGGLVTNKSVIKVEGEVEDDSYAEKITINSVPVFVELSAKKLPFSKQIKLKKGTNEIKIRALDLTGKAAEKKIRVIADFEGPLVNLTDFADGQRVTDSRVVLNGILADATGITGFVINDKIFKHNREKRVGFSHAVDLREGKNRIAFSATDVAGNTTSGELNLIYVPKPAAGKQYSGYERNTGEPIRLVLQGSGVLDTGRHRLFAVSMPGYKRTDFRLALKDLVDTQTVYYDTIYIDGSVTCSSEIDSVKINGSTVFIIPGRTIYFNQLVELFEGKNIISIEARDARGNSISKTVTIVRKVPKIHQVGSRMSLAIMPFEIKGQATSASTIVYDNLVSSFFNQNRFNIVSRGAELEAALRELKLSATELVDKSKAVKVGRLVAAEGILTGSIRETKDSLEIYARLINTETSTLFDARDVYGQSKTLSRIQYLTNGLALKFKHSFPLLEGMVVKVDGKNIFADFGSIQHIKKEMKFIVFREGELIVHPVTGKVLGSETEELGVATVVKVFEDISMGKLEADFHPDKIRVEDLIITK